MKTGIHPDYMEAKVTCSCGETFITRATVPELKVEICSKCHPLYSGKQKFIDTGGRVERFQRKYADSLKTKKPAKAAPAPVETVAEAETATGETETPAEAAE